MSNTLHNISPQPKSNGPILVAYLLMLVGTITGIAAIIGVIIAYLVRSDVRGTYLETHCTFIIHSFWYAIVLAIIGGALTVVFVGFLVLLFLLIWFIVRCIRGILQLGKGEAIDNPTGLMSFG